MPMPTIPTRPRTALAILADSVPAAVESAALGDRWPLRRIRIATARRQGGELSMPFEHATARALCHACDSHEWAINARVAGCIAKAQEHEADADHFLTVAERLIARGEG